MLIGYTKYKTLLILSLHLFTFFSNFPTYILIRALMYLLKIKEICKCVCPKKLKYAINLLDFFKFMSKNYIFYHIFFALLKLKCFGIWNKNNY